MNKELTPDQYQIAYMNLMDEYAYKIQEINKEYQEKIRKLGEKK